MPIATLAPVAKPSPSTPAVAKGPKIYTLSAAPAVVHAGQSVSFAAHTSADVATVTASVSAYKLNFARTAPGRFALAFAIPPNVPIFFHGTYSLNVTASAVDGTSVSRAVTITFQ